MERELLMAERRPVRAKRSPAVRATEVVVVVGVAVVAAIIAFSVLSAIVGTLWFIVKAVVVVAVIAAVIKFLMHRRGR